MFPSSAFPNNSNERHVKTTSLGPIFSFVFLYYTFCSDQKSKRLFVPCDYYDKSVPRSHWPAKKKRKMLTYILMPIVILWWILSSVDAGVPVTSTCLSWHPGCTHDATDGLLVSCQKQTLYYNTMSCSRTDCRALNIHEERKGEELGSSFRHLDSMMNI